MLFRDVQSHAVQFLFQFTRCVAAVVGQEEIGFLLILQPFYKLLHPRQNDVPVVDHSVHITDEAFFLVKINCCHNYHILTSDIQSTLLRAPFLFFIVNYKFTIACSGCRIHSLFNL